MLGGCVVARSVQNKIAEKYDWLLDEPLMNAEYASRRLDVDGAREVARALVSDET